MNKCVHVQPLHQHFNWNNHIPLTLDFKSN